MSFTVKIDPAWLAAQITEGKSDELILEEIDKSIDAGLKAEAKLISDEMRKLLGASPNGSGGNDVP